MGVLTYSRREHTRALRTMRSRTRVAIIDRRKLQAISIEVVDMATVNRY